MIRSANGTRRIGWEPASSRSLVVVLVVVVVVSVRSVVVLVVLMVVVVLVVVRGGRERGAMTNRPVTTNIPVPVSVCPCVRGHVCTYLRADGCA